MNPTLPTTRADWYRRVWSVAWPIMLSNVSVPLVGIVDTAVVGHLPDPTFIGAVALGAVVFSFSTGASGFYAWEPQGWSPRISGRGTMTSFAQPSPGH